LGWVVPLARVEIELVLAHPCDSLDRKNGLSVEVVEMVANFSVLGFVFGLEMVLENFSEQHLSHSDHAPPSCVGHEGVVLSEIL
jgi:hypothetical protein